LLIGAIKCQNIYFVITASCRQTGIDVDEDALVVARDRCEAYGVDATLKEIDGQQLLSNFSPGSFDFIIYFACLEHMTVAERLESLQQAWSLLPSGEIVAIIEKHQTASGSATATLQCCPSFIGCQMSLRSPTRSLAMQQLSRALSRLRAKLKTTFLTPRPRDEFS
jgi:ubiquinone/menaquinone biosynthesis C-methylase UbiE